MKSTRIAAIIFIILGVIGLLYGSFSYTKRTHQTNIGPVQLSIREKQTVNIPVWAGIGAIVIGGVLLVVRRKIF